MKGLRAVLLGAMAHALITLAPTAQAAQVPIHFADLNWESGSLITEMLRLVLENGFDQPTDTLPGTTITLEAALARNDIQVIAEEWAGRSPVWNQAQAQGKVAALGDTVKGATEGWWVPEYVIKGDTARGITPKAPDLRSVNDLKKSASVFRDPEAPSMGRFLNSPAGWTSEVVNGQKLKAYGLAGSFTNFRTGSGAALDAEINSAIRRGQPVLFYYWSPTPLIGKYKLVQLEEPAFDEQAWETLTDANEPHPRASRSPPSRLSIGVSAAFEQQHPDIATFFSKVDIPLQPLNEALAQMSDRHEAPRAVAQRLLKANPQWLQGWLPAPVAAKVSASL
ncbi:ABC transporter substrate-binding protein [Pseudomonas typographi]|uniref:ABC transporter substrate-binding protein n=1 Tax=Pseudomonas typographi TaxID=2715964 RepID=UPI00168681BB|nr:ABC transporter substrate-binding protein [Pseudomonas typographi]MBD1554028.1 ABC transporter substrate-binding protein [Pseudomonas typographi]